MLNFKVKNGRYSNDKIEKQYEIARDGWTADYNDPMTFLDMF